MAKTILLAARAARGARGFMALPAADREIVVYAEGPDSWPHLGPVVERVARGRGRRVAYLTSAPADPRLEAADENVQPFYVGEGMIRTFLFRIMEAGVLVMTMPDLQTYGIKRSRYPVHYLYVHHSIVSTHMIYRPGAFDHFDTVFCVGPHHVAEIRETEALSGLPAKSLVEHGYGRLDAILAAGTKDGPRTTARGEGANVLIAPSWGTDSLLEVCGEGLVELLLQAGHRVTVRPHPMTRRHTPMVLDSLYRRFAGRPGFAHEEDMASQDSLHASDLMISDWSGAALEYAFGLERPVLFVDVPRKVNNPEYERLGSPPIEARIREEIGAILDPAALAEAPRLVTALCARPGDFALRIRAARGKWIYNVGRSGEVGGDYVVDLVDSGRHRVTR